MSCKEAILERLTELKQSTNDMLQLSPWPSFSEEEVDAAAKVLLSNKVNYWTGNEGREFEIPVCKIRGSGLQCIRVDEYERWDVTNNFIRGNGMTRF